MKILSRLKTTSSLPEKLIKSFISELKKDYDDAKYYRGNKYTSAEYMDFIDAERENYKRNNIKPDGKYFNKELAGYLLDDILRVNKTLDGLEETRDSINLFLEDLIRLNNGMYDSDKEKTEEVLKALEKCKEEFKKLYGVKAIY